MFCKFIKLIFIILTTSIIVGNSTFSNEIIPDPLLYQEMPFDVLHYNLELDLRNYSSREVSGNCKVSVRRIEFNENDYFIFHLKTLKVQSIKWNEKELEYSAYGSEDSPEFHYRVNYPDSETEIVVFDISYSGKVSAEVGAMSWGGVHFEEAVFYALGVGFSAPYVSTTRHWMPCFDLPQDKATYSARFRVPSNFRVASNGLLDEIIELEDNSLVYSWVHHYPSATYLLTFAAGPYQLLDYTDYKIPIQVFSLMVDSVRSDFAYSEVKEMNNCFESMFGPYPFEKIGYTNVSKGAMEHQTMISMPRRTIVELAAAKNSNNIIAAHELSHMWFGNMVTPLDFRHAWMNESFATYCESLWMRCREGSGAYRKNLLNKKDIYINEVAPREGVMPLFDFPRAQPSSNYPVTIYEKGAVVLGMLSYHISQNGSKFEDLIKTYLNIFAYGNAQTNDIFRVIESETEENMDWFADQWINKAGWPIFDLVFDDIQDAKYSNHLQLRQVQTGGFYQNVPVELNFYLSNGIDYKQVTIVVSASGEYTDYTLEGYPGYTIDSVKANQGVMVVGLYEIRSIRTVTSVTDNQISKPKFHTNGDIVNINYESSIGKAVATISDIYGRVIDSYESNSNIGMNTIRFSLVNEANGVYFINMMIDNSFHSHKISIIR